MRLSQMPSGKSAFALISVLALVSLAALSATAFLASARLEKTASMTIGDQTRLTLALDSGYHLGSYNFTKGDPTWNWADFLVGETNDGNDSLGYLFHAYPYTGTNTSLSGTWYNYATFSCATMSNIGMNDFDPATNSVTTTWQGGFASNRTDTNSRLYKMLQFSAATNYSDPACPVTRIPLLFNRTSLPVNWITNYVTNPTTGLLTPTFRFAYFTEDPSGLIDAERMGGSTNRNTGTNPNEISLSQIGLTTNMTSFRKLFINPGLIQETILSNSLNQGAVTNPWRYLSSSFYSMNGSLSTSTGEKQGYQRIPAGLGYLQADRTNDSQLKYNLNSFFINGNAVSSAQAAIRDAITNNLPTFASNRAGGLNFTNYINTLAANIVDYADNNSDPTCVINAGGAGISVGYDNYPLPVVFSDEILWNQILVNGHLSNSTITVTTYLQFWNLSSITSPATSYGFVNNFQDVYLTTSGGIGPRIFTNSLSNTISVPSLGPNQIVVLTVTNTTTAGTNASYPGGLIGLTLSNNVPTTTYLALNTNNSSSYRNCTNLYRLINSYGYEVSAHYGTYTRIGKVNLVNGTFEHQATVLPMSITKTNFAPVGDPRMCRLISNPPAQPLEYRSSSSRNLKWNGYPNFYDHGPLNSTALAWNGHPQNWPDGWNTNVAPATGTSQTSDTSHPPVTIGALSNLPGPAPAILSTNGKYKNIFELGNIFDPMQWRPASGFITNADYVKYSINTNWVADRLYGGGNSLRIGRPEHPRFAWTNISGNDQPNMQASAVALLDIFCADTNTVTAIQGRFDDGNQININTAPPNVLRALAAGVILTNDATMGNYSIPSAAVEAFVKGVTNFRTKYPFYSASQLAFIGTNANWPNTSTWPDGAVFSANVVKGTAPSLPWNDAAAEEWFSKIYALSKVQSRNYRIYVQAQLIKTRGTNTNAPNYLSWGAIGRRYYDVLNQQNNNYTSQQGTVAPSCSVYLLRKVDY